MESKWNETFGSDLFGTNTIQETWSGRQAANKAATRVPGAPPPSWAPRGSTDLLLPPIYTHVPQNQPGVPLNTISTDATFCTREIPSWGLFRHSAGGASITEGFYINTIASPMMCEQFTTNLRVHSYQLDGFFSLFGSQYKVLLDLLGDLFDVTIFAVCLSRSDELWVYDQDYL